MAVVNAYTLYAAIINGTMLDQFSNVSVDTGIEDAIMAADGDIDPTFTAVQKVQPRISFTTTKVATALDLTGIAPLNIDSNKAYFYFKKYAQGGTFESGSAHLRLTVNKGMVFPRSLSASDTSAAEMNYDVICLFDGTNSPIIVEKDQALTGTPSVSEIFYVGPAAINGTAINGVTSMSFEFGLSELLLGGDGEAYNSFAAISGRRPVITIETPDLDIYETLGDSGVPQGATPSKFYLRKLENGGSRVANATEEHISLSIYEGSIRPLNPNGSMGSVTTMSIRCTPVYDGTNDIVSIDTTAAIS